MDPAREERLARNEAFFRGVNENIKAVASDFAYPKDTYEFLCECADVGCTDRISLTLGDYERIRSSPVRFVLARGHVVDEIENVVRREDDHVVVEKRGRAATIAASLDVGGSPA